MLRPTILAPAFAALSLMGSSVANAAVVLQIDVSNPSAVKIMATTAFSEGNSSLTVGLDGFTIQNLFKTSITVFSDTAATSSNLRPAGTSDAYEGVATIDFEGGAGAYTASNDFYLFSTTTPYNNPQIFSTTSRAFEGTLIVNLGAFPGALPAVGTAGSVLSGYLPSGTGQGVTIGQFQVIPEPTSPVVIGLGTAGLCCRRRRK